MSDHTPYFPDNITEYAPWVAKYGLLQPYGKCQCGCGEDAPIAKRTDNIKRLTTKGMAQRFLMGHSHSRPAAIVFWENVDARGPEDCWLWQGDTYGMGYGRFQAHNKIYRTHQFSYALHIGPITKSLLVCHKCDNPRCVNPKHLYLGTPQDNMDDMMTRGRNRPTPGESNFHAKLNNEKVAEIRRLYKDGAICSDIARRYGVSRSLISMIARYKIWLSVP